MSRWTVRLHQSHRNGALHPKLRWVVDPPGYDHKLRAEHTGNWHRAGGKWFQWGGDVSKREAWREALAYADRMARTREVVLPRPDKDGDIATTDEQVAWENTEFERTVVSVAWIEEPGTIALSTGDSDHYMTTDGALSIALALAALAEQDKQCGE